MERFLAARQYFMGIGLVAHIKDDLIIRGVKNIMNCNREFHGSEACAKMAGVERDHIDDKLPDLRAKLGQLINTEFPQVFRAVDVCKQRSDSWCHWFIEIAGANLR